MDYGEPPILPLAGRQFDHSPLGRGEGNRSRDPDEAVLARLAAHGATVVRTDELGSIEVISDGVGYKVRVGR